MSSFSGGHDVITTDELEMKHAEFAASSIVTFTLVLCEKGPIS